MNTIGVDERLRDPPLHFEARLVDESDRTLVVLCGELDLAAVLWVDANLQTTHGRAQLVVVDCAAVTFIDAAGIRLLLRLLDAPHSCLAGVPPGVARLLRIVDLDHLVDTTKGGRAADDRHQGRRFHQAHRGQDDGCEQCQDAGEHESPRPIP
jgi:anti-anti-sigma factor